MCQPFRSECKGIGHLCRALAQTPLREETLLRFFLHLLLLILIGDIDEVHLVIQTSLIFELIFRVDSGDGAVQGIGFFNCQVSGFLGSYLHERVCAIS